MMFRVNYITTAAKNRMKTGALIVSAETAAEAAHKARSQLSTEFDWHKITATIQLKDDQQELAL